ncbi:MAG: ATP-binding protein [Firmicutes bacterium]|nr:ATP-binding protein [Bacillota bacterium]
MSIKEKITFSLDSSASKKLPQNIIKSDKGRILRSAVIYGPNASGKSNLIKSVFFIWSLVKHSHSFNVDTKLNNINPKRMPFKLDPKYLKKPSRFEIQFIYKKIKYKYGFSCDDNRIVDEYLFYWPKGRESLIFKREKTKKFLFTINKNQQKTIEKQMNDNVLYLSRATQLGYGETKLAYEFIVNNITINPYLNDINMAFKEISDNPKLNNWILSFLKKTDFGGIEDIQINKKKGWKNTLVINKGGDISQKHEEAEVYNPTFIHKNSDSALINFGIEEESLGTQKTIMMLVPFFDAINSGKIVIIDELESSLHPNISKLLIRLFNRKNVSNAQLIFTTHNTGLLDEDLFRRDQVYICSKESNKNTLLRSLLDFALREDADFERAYLNGRVGGIPFIDETLLEEMR